MTGKQRKGKMHLQYLVLLYEFFESTTHLDNEVSYTWKNMAQYQCPKLEFNSKIFYQAVKLSWINPGKNFANSALALAFY